MWHGLACGCVLELLHASDVRNGYVMLLPCTGIQCCACMTIAQSVTSVAAAFIQVLSTPSCGTVVVAHGSDELLDPVLGSACAGWHQLVRESKLCMGGVDAYAGLPYVLQSDILNHEMLLHLRSSSAHVCMQTCMIRNSNKCKYAHMQGPMSHGCCWSVQ